jgi:hypothetical protein
MANKPAKLCELQKDKFIGGQEGFCDTFNWATQSISNLKGGKNCSVDWESPDKPVINVNVPDSGSGGSGNKDIMAVYDVVESTQGSGSGSQNGIEVQYVDDRTPTFIPFSGGGGQTTIIGTDGSSYTGDSFEFASANDSNVTVSIDQSGVMTIGVYYV